MAKMARGNLKIFKTSERESFYLDVEKLAKKISSKTKVLILNTPCNPTGRVLKEKDVKFLAELSLKKNFILISDEVYEIYDFEKIYCSFLKFFHKNIFCVFSASKIFSLCGWRLGWGFGNENIIKEMRDYQSNLSTSPSTFSQLMIRELFKNEKEVLKYFEKNEKMAKERRDFATSFLRKKKIDFIFPEGGIAIFVKIPKNLKDSFSFAEKLLLKEKVSVAPGEIFGQKNYFRMNLAVPLEDLKEGLKKIAKFY
ncbi:MAG: pyridoxal phosphate-dependent aminotransferase [Patescibacteria group bacterium]|nr:pyridoxal phosphate-dependent aminotransferase [Patescibacteria group bacterium]